VAAVSKKKTARRGAAPTKTHRKAKPASPLFYYLENPGASIMAGLDEVDEVMETLPNVIGYEFGTVSEGEEPPEGAEKFKTQAQLDRRIAKAEKANDAEFERAANVAARMEKQSKGI
jgi:hypothetical protein